jgi:NAD(P)-dependent dehydrogenase (short-subunit alcohol dehydrogenase family)
MDTNTTSRTWLITGASSGLGRHLAEAALKEGENVVVTARNAEALRDLFQNHARQAHALALDVTDAGQINEAVSAAVQRFGRIDVLINNAGCGLLAALEETDDERMAKNLATNLTGPLRLMRAVIPVMRAQPGGRIINIGAIAGFSNDVGFSVYGAAKAGLEAASDAVAGEVAPFGIQVTVVVPGPFRTDFISRSLDRAPRLLEYKATVGNFETVLNRINGRQPGNPTLAAAAIIALSRTERQPRRLLLGKYAYENFSKKLKAHTEEMNAWAHLGLPTDYAAGTG